MRVGDFRVPGTAISGTTLFLTRACEKGRLKSLTIVVGDTTINSGRAYAMFGVMKGGVTREHMVAVLDDGYMSGHDGFHWVGDYPLDAAASVFIMVVSNQTIGFTFMGSMELADP